MTSRYKWRLNIGTERFDLLGNDNTWSPAPKFYPAISFPLNADEIVTHTHPYIQWRREFSGCIVINGTLIVELEVPMLDDAIHLINSGDIIAWVVRAKMDGGQIIVPARVFERVCP